ncbi:hypothetical protein [Streptomyces sp. NPDC002533]
MASKLRRDADCLQASAEGVRVDVGRVAPPHDPVRPHRIVRRRDPLRRDINYLKKQEKEPNPTQPIPVAT